MAVRAGVSAAHVIIGASGGIGSAIADARAARGERVIALARSFSGADAIDLEDEASIAAAAQRLQGEGPIASVLVATGLLHDDRHGPEKSLRDLDPAWLQRNFAVNAIGPALVAKHLLPILPRRGPALFAAIGARVGSISDNRLGGWYGYRAAKAALHMMICNIAIEWRRRNDQAVAVALHPGTVDTPLSQPFQGNVPEGRLFTAEQAAGQLLAVLDALEPADSGTILAWDGSRITP